MACAVVAAAANAPNAPDASGSSGTPISSRYLLDAPDVEDAEAAELLISANASSHRNMASAPLSETRSCAAWRANASGCVIRAVDNDAD